MTTSTFPRAFAATLGATLALAAGSASAMTTTCADFMAMGAEDQMAEVAMMHDAMALDGVAADDATGTDDAMASDDAMAADDAMAGGDMAADTMATDDAMAPDAMATDDAMDTDEMAAIMAACEGNPDMMVMDAVPTDAMAPATN